ncbi:MAG: prolipoprotein diacylglyceryl transferase family protein [Myxococcota bacterium]
MFPTLARILVPTPWAPEGFGPVVLSSFGVSLAVSLALGWAWMQRWARRSRCDDPSRIGLAFVAAVATALVGARLFYVAVNPNVVATTVRDALAFARGGLSLYGAWWGGWLGAWLVLRVRPESVWRFGDAGVVAVAIGFSMTRLGSYVSGSDFGRTLPSSAPMWLRRLGTFPAPPSGTDGLPRLEFPLVWWSQVRSGVLGPESANALPVHPTQLYEACLGLTLALLAWRMRPTFAGERLLFAAWCDAGGRFATECLRGDLDRGVFTLPVSAPLGGVLAAALLVAAWATGLKGATALRVRGGAVAFGLVAVLAAAAMMTGPETALRLSATQLGALLTTVLVAAAYRQRQGKKQNPEAGPDGSDARSTHAKASHL